MGSGPLWLSFALRTCLQSPCLAHKALARLGASLLRSSTLFWSECTNTFDIFRMLLRVIQSVILKGEFEGGSRKLASGTSGREMGWQRIKSENAGDSTLDRKER